jgi:hypothetical protein
MDADVAKAIEIMEGQFTAANARLDAVERSVVDACAVLRKELAAAIINAENQSVGEVSGLRGKVELGESKALAVKARLDSLWATVEDMQTQITDLQQPTPDKLQQMIDRIKAML